MQRTLLLLLVAASYLLFAGAPSWTTAPLLGLAALAVAAAPRRTLTFPREWRALDLALIAIVAAMLLQTVPLPPALVSTLSPEADRLRAALAFATLDTTGWPPLSIDAAATRRSAATVTLGILAFWVARALFGAGGNTRSFCRMLAVLGAVVAVAAIVQKTTAPRLLLFVMTPEARSASPFGAFTNRNHFAAWLLLVTAPVCGYLIARLRTHPAYRARHWREALKRFLGSGIVLTAVSVATTVLVMLATLSRSAVAGLGAAALCGWGLGRHRMNVERTSLPKILGVVGILLVAAMAFVDIDGWAVRLQHTWNREPVQFSRLTIWRESLPMVRDFWLTGTGAGTFSDAMSQYQQTRMWVGSMGRWAHFNNAHSTYVQVASEGGLLLAIPALTALALFGVLGYRAVRADKGEMFWVRVGAAAGLVGLAVQGVWEVPLIMPANAVLCGVVAGLVLSRRDGSQLAGANDSLATPARLSAT
ncbi:MAG: O-antigen ligase family protein [Acidobacteriota bacterium]|nr:O-antigen ligase family protein [Acidobacteriota bacterium]